MVKLFGQLLKDNPLSRPLKIARFGLTVSTFTHVYFMFLFHSFFRLLNLRFLDFYIYRYFTLIRYNFTIILIFGYSSIKKFLKWSNPDSILNGLGYLRPRFCLCSVFSNKYHNFYNKKGKMFIQHLVLGFEPTTS